MSTVESGHLAKTTSSGVTGSGGALNRGEAPLGQLVAEIVVTRRVRVQQSAAALAAAKSRLLRLTSGNVGNLAATPGEGGACYGQTLSLRTRPKRNGSGRFSLRPCARKFGPARTPRESKFSMTGLRPVSLWAADDADRVGEQLVFVWRAPNKEAAGLQPREGMFGRLMPPIDATASPSAS
jgi:hypothetical protein